MKSHVTAEFRRLFSGLPIDVQQRARRSYLLWREDPSHPSVQFKRIHRDRAIYSVRVGLGWRALGVRDSETLIWFWIGSHADYDRL